MLRSAFNWGCCPNPTGLKTDTFLVFVLQRGLMVRRPYFHYVELQLTVSRTDNYIIDEFVETNKLIQRICYYSNLNWREKIESSHLV